MKCVQKLLKSTKNTKIGNHSVQLTHCKEIYNYHKTSIFVVDHKEKTIQINDGGWKTSSTTRAINSYMRNEYITNLIENYKYKVVDMR